MQAFGCDHRKGIILLQLQWEGLALMYEQRISSLVPLEIPYFLFSTPSGNRIEYLKNVAKM
jgi:hypothetical protein